MPPDRSERIAQLEQAAAKNRNNPTGGNARMDLDRIFREIAEERTSELREHDLKVADRRHSEALAESQRATRWGVAASVVAAFGTLAAIAGLLVPFVLPPSEQRASLPAPTLDHSASSSGTDTSSNTAKPAVLPTPLAAPTNDAKGTDKAADPVVPDKDQSPTTEHPTE